MSADSLLFLPRQHGFDLADDAAVLGGARLGQRGLRGGEARDGHAIGRAAHVVEPQLMAELYRIRIAAVLAANAELDVGTGLPAEGDGGLHQLADAGDIERGERVLLE